MERRPLLAGNWKMHTSMAQLSYRIQPLGQITGKTAANEPIWATSSVIIKKESIVVNLTLYIRTGEEVISANNKRSKRGKSPSLFSINIRILLKKGIFLESSNCWQTKWIQRVVNESIKVPFSVLASVIAALIAAILL